MSYIEDYGLTSPSRKYSLVALVLKDSKGCTQIDIMHLQKIIRYFEYLRNSKDIAYSNYRYGVVSYQLEENIERLQDNGLVDRDERDTLTLTPEGQEFAEKLLQDLDKKELEKLTFAKQQLNDLPLDELMYFMYRLIPESVVNSTEYPRLERKRVSLVQSLFLKGKINSATAAKWLDMSEKDFLDSLCK
jgi:DNA-binding PadR family transcriptional regulator